MAYDDILIGSGLAALAVAIGLPGNRKVLVLSGIEPPVTKHYPQAPNVPRSHLGQGGLGTFWHGVIPFGAAEADDTPYGRAWRELFGRFYPLALPSPGETTRFFVPRKPVRPHHHWPALMRQRSLAVTPELATSIGLGPTGAQVRTSNNTYEARRVWCCAGALGTPTLLASCFGEAVARGLVDDHVIIYLGIARRSQDIRPRISTAAGGYWFDPLYSDPRGGVVTPRPAVADFSRLDAGFERRAAFGLPARSIVGRLLQQPSLGLVTEAVFNKLGLLPGSRYYSLYAQVLVRDAYEFDAISGDLAANADAITEATTGARAEALQRLPTMVPSARPDLYIPGVHLHHTVNLQVANGFGLSGVESPLQVADASIMDAIGPEHHSFRMMARAMLQARSTS